MAMMKNASAQLSMTNSLRKWMQHERVSKLHAQTGPDFGV